MLHDPRAAVAPDPAALATLVQGLLARRLACAVADAAVPDLPLLWVSPAFLALTGYELDEVIGRNCRFLQGPETDPAAVQRLRAALAAGRPCCEILLNYRKDGSTFVNELRLEPVADATGRRYVLGIQTDLKATFEGYPRVEIERLLQLERNRANGAFQLALSLLRLHRRTLPDADPGHTLDAVLERLEQHAWIHRMLERAEAGPVVLADRLLTALVREQGGGAAAPRAMALAPVAIETWRRLPFALFVAEALNGVGGSAEAGPAPVGVELAADPAGGWRLTVARATDARANRPRTDPVTRILLEGLAQQLGGRLSLEPDWSRLVLDVTAARQSAAERL
jgi:PAS domain S-box-containing protein